jgi:ElaB/YqjD/DUF883 family membrane-anchored ribosome-binding protein
MEGGQFETRDESMTEKAANAASQAGRSAINKIDEKRENAAGKLDSAASKMHQMADAGGQRVSSTVHSAAQGLESTAEYLRQHDTKRVISDLGNLVKSYPGQSLLIAAGVGFLMGRAFRNA